MSPQAADPEALLAVARSLAAFRERLTDAEDELLGAHVSPGDLALLSALDTHVEQVVDVLRALGEAAGEQTLTLRNVAAAHAESETVVARDSADLRRAGDRRVW